MRNVTPEQVAMAEQHRRGELPDRIEGALGELAGAAKEGLMALSVGVGLGVLHELMAAVLSVPQRDFFPTRPHGGYPTNRRGRLRRGLVGWCGAA
jgi:hypothetical protein